MAFGGQLHCSGGAQVSWQVIVAEGEMIFLIAKANPTWITLHFQAETLN